MPKTKSTAREFILGALSQHPDRELQLADIHELAHGKFQRGNLDVALRRLLVEGKVTKVTEPDRSAWWGIADGGVA